MGSAEPNGSGDKPRETAGSVWPGGETSVPSLKKRISRLGLTRNLSFAFLVFIFPAVVAITWAANNHVGLTFATVMGYLELVAILVFLVSRLRLRDLQAELRTLELEEDILKNAKESPILLFLKHQAELKRYYDQALQQSGLAFVLGVFCVIAGLGVIAVGFTLIQGDSNAERIVAGALAAVGAILTGFVARVYLGIHDGAVKSLSGFHEKFVETHHLHIAGVFASRVDDEEKRDAALLALVEAAGAPSPSA